MDLNVIMNTECFLMNVISYPGQNDSGASFWVLGIWIGMNGINLKGHKLDI